jgi:hypothetical protein
VFVLALPDVVGKWMHLTIDLKLAIGFDYHDQREVPEELAARARDIISGLFIEFPPLTTLVLYEVKL